MPHRKIGQDDGTEDTEGQALKWRGVETGEPQSDDTDGNVIRVGHSPQVDGTEDTDGNMIEGH